MINARGTVCSKCGHALISRERCGECRRIYARDHYRQNKMRKRGLHGLTRAEAEAVIAGQNNKCAACGSPPRGGVNDKLHIDHCHTTGKVGKALCGCCNRALGMVQDSPELLRKLADYLEENR